MRRFALLVAGFIAAVAFVGCAGGGDEASTTEEAATKPQRVGAISFVFYRAGGDDAAGIYTIDPDGGDLRLLVRNAEAPVWSADGQVLAYYDDSCGVSVLDVAGMRTRQVVSADLSGYCQQTTISPDGEHVAFVHVAFVSDGIWTMPVGGGTHTQLTFEQFDDNPQWSPDGRNIAFLRWQDDKIGIVESDGGEAREVTAPGMRISQELVWSPDGRRIALGGGGDDVPHLRVLDIDSGRITTVAPSLRAVFARPAWSPDGTRLALRERGETYVVRVSSGVVRRVMVDAGDPVDYSDVSWSPDGKRLAVPVNDELWVVRADGTVKKRLLAGGYGSSIEDVQWHPGALRSSALGGKPVTTLAPVVHVKALGDTYDACGIELWRPEGSRWLVAGEGNTGRAYARPLRPGVWEILDYKRDAIGQAAATNSRRTRWNITDASGTLVGTAQSPDGAWIALVLLWGGADCFD